MALGGSSPRGAPRQRCWCGRRILAARHRAWGRVRRRLVRYPEGRLQPYPRRRSGQRPARRGVGGRGGRCGARRDRQGRLDRRRWPGRGNREAREPSPPAPAVGQDLNRETPERSPLRTRSMLGERCARPAIPVCRSTPAPPRRVSRRPAGTNRRVPTGSGSAEPMGTGTSCVLAPTRSLRPTGRVKRRRQEERDVLAPRTGADTDRQATLHLVSWCRVSHIQHVPVRLSRAEAGFLAHRADRTRFRIGHRSHSSEVSVESVSVRPARRQARKLDATPDDVIAPAVLRRNNSDPRLR